MDYMIIIKWLTNWDKVTEETGEMAPGIINTMIIMFIQMGNKPEAGKFDTVQADLMKN